MLSSLHFKPICMYTSFPSRPALIYVLGVSLFMLTIPCLAQKPTQLDPTVFVIVEHQPEFPGGQQALYDYLRSNVQTPAEAVKAKITDRVIISFIVEPDGKLTDFQFVRSWGYGCDEEAMRVVKAMPDWIPGTQSGRAMRVRYNLPVLFGMDYPKVRVR